MVKTKVNKERRREKYFSDGKDVLTDLKLLIKYCPLKYLMISCSSQPHLSFPQFLTLLLPG